MSLRSPALRVAMISLHTSPLDQPGTGDSGGMNVYVRSVAEGLGDRGVAVDIFTRCSGRRVPEVEWIGPRTRVIQAQGGPCSAVPKEALPGLVPLFTRSLAGRSGYDVVHAHYWLSGWAGMSASARWGAPLVVSFHTLGKVKELVRSDGEAPEPPARLGAERSVIDRADRVLAPTPAEWAHLVDLYGADPARIRIVPPGVDLGRFNPRAAAEAKRALGAGAKGVVLFVGRLQPLKGPDLAIRVLAEAIRLDPSGTRDVLLLVVGGPSGPRGGYDEVARLMDLAASLGVSERVRFLPPRTRRELPGVYGAADVLIVPSRSESFGLVALEAQACGVPVVASAVGGLRHVVADGKSGYLVCGRDPRPYAERVLAVLGRPRLAARLRLGALERASSASWDVTVDRLLSVYGELAAGRAPRRELVS